MLTMKMLIRKKDLIFVSFVEFLAAIVFFAHSIASHKGHKIECIVVGLFMAVMFVFHLVQIRNWERRK